jgi:hypothetical protein
MSQPFARARAQLALVAAAMLLAPLAQATALRAIPGYASNGKRKTATHHLGGHRRAQRAAAKARNVLANRKAHR